MEVSLEDLQELIRGWNAVYTEPPVPGSFDVKMMLRAYELFENDADWNFPETGPYVGKGRYMKTPHGIVFQERFTQQMTLITEASGKVAGLV